ncbi:MAG: hypothetical protein JWN98_833, partial [Abditibacteriota bacterium]|nr:hypothetical protein [Abditibacteriota bacterium]
EALLKGGENGPVVLPGDPQKSSLFHVVNYDGEIQMPPKGKMKPSEIASLAQWIKMGAPWSEPRKPSARAAASSASTPESRRRFWSFLPVRRPNVPAVKNTSWVKSPVDAFVLAELEKKKLAPAAAADRRTLIRRASFDLTGLPPTPREVRAFVADKSPDAYKLLIERLLASPAYGERWGRHWLDVARYADSLDARGLGSKGDIAEAWRYRDWVVQAFNRDLPYNQFIMQQVAGDILAASAPASSPNSAAPASTPRYDSSAIVATGLLAIGNWGNGDADKEKVITDIADDQVDIVSRGFMGLTVSCARCHDHKFDPISTRDYYALSGMFFSTHILPKMADKSAGEAPLLIPLASQHELQQRQQHNARMATAEAQLKAATRTHYAAFAKGMLPHTARYLNAIYAYQKRAQEEASLTVKEFAAQQGLHEYALRQWMSELGMGDYRLMTNFTRDLGGNAGVHGFKGEEETPGAVINTNVEAKTLLTFTLPPRSVSIHPGPRDGVVVGWRSPVRGTIHVRGSVTDADPVGGDGVAWAIEHRRNGRAQPLDGGEIANGSSQKFPTEAATDGPLAAIAVEPGDFIELLVLPKSSHGFDTTVVDFVLEHKGSNAVWDLAGDIVGNLAEIDQNPHRDRLGHADVWRFGDLKGIDRGKAASPGPGDATSPVARWKAALALALAAQSPTAQAAGKSVLERASVAVQESFTAIDNSSPFWLHSRDSESVLPPAAHAELERLTAEHDALRKATPPPLQYAHGAQEGGIPESAYAGFHDVRVHKRGSYARLGDVVPRAFPAVLAGERQPRITKGSGRLELARWLAGDKHPLTARVMVNRIWQHHFGDGIVRTPSNFGFLGERPTHPALLDYLASEFVRSKWSIKQMHRVIMLSATYQQSSLAGARARQIDPDNRLFGRMNRRRLESEAIRDNLLSVAGRLDRSMGGPAARDFTTPRRTLYVMTVRSDRAGYGPLFDAADATASVDRRTVSTVAPQALFLMNNPFAVEQAQALTKRLLASSTDDRVRLAHAYLLLYGRSPTPQETAIGLTFVGNGKTQKVSEQERQREAWEQYCHILLCANEFIYID